MTANNIQNDGTFVYNILSNDTAGIGDKSQRDGNGFVQGTGVSGVVEIPRYIGDYRITTLHYCSLRNCNKITKLYKHFCLKPNQIGHCGYFSSSFLHRYLLEKNVT